MNKIWGSSCGRIELSFTKSEYNSVPASGPADDAVSTLIKKPRVLVQFALISDSLIVEVLREYGAWEDSELIDRQANIERMVWIATLDIQEAVD